MQVCSGEEKIEDNEKDKRRGTNYIYSRGTGERGCERGGGRGGRGESRGDDRVHVFPPIYLSMYCPTYSPGPCMYLFPLLPFPLPSPLSLSYSSLSFTSSSNFLALTSFIL